MNYWKPIDGERINKDVYDIQKVFTWWIESDKITDILDVRGSHYIESPWTENYELSADNFVTIKGVPRDHELTVDPEERRTIRLRNDIICDEYASWFIDYYETIWICSYETDGKIWRALIVENWPPI